jgi:hypothetical protein
MRSAGNDDAFGTADDAIYTLTASGNSRAVDLRVIDGPPQPGRHRFTARAAGLLDRFGNPLDGNGDGTGGDDLVRSFNVVIPQGQVLESRSNDSIPAATALSLFEDPAGSGFFTSAIAVGSIDPYNESDYWSFTAQQSDRLIIDSESRGGANFIPRFIVYNAAGTSLVDTGGGGFGGPAKLTNEVYSIPATGTYYVRLLDQNQNEPGSYQFRVDLGRGVQLERYDYNFYNNDLSQAANYPLTFTAGAAGHLLASVAGSLYSQEGLDYYPLGRLDGGNQVVVVVGRSPSAG